MDFLYYWDREEAHLPRGFSRLRTGNCSMSPFFPLPTGFLRWVACPCSASVDVGGATAIKSSFLAYSNLCHKRPHADLTENCQSCGDPRLWTACPAYLFWGQRWVCSVCGKQSSAILILVGLHRNQTITFTELNIAMLIPVCADSQKEDSVPARQHTQWEMLRHSKDSSLATQMAAQVPGGAGATLA